MADARGLDGAARVGLFGFGNSAQLIAQVARGEGQEVYAYTRGEAGQRLARELGAVWSGGGEDVPPVELDAVIVFAPVGPLVPFALRTVRKGGTVVCAGIHMTPIPEFDYDILWGERAVRSVANLTRRDGYEFMELATRHPIETRVEVFPLERANQALRGQKVGTLGGTAVLVP
jgi:propanol-preferring alcohol dehydrogenase